MEKAYEQILNYGALGAICIILIAALIVAARVFIKNHEKNEARIVQLEDNMTKYLLEDKKVILEVIKDCQKALENSSSAIGKNNELFEELIKKMK